MDQEKKIKAPRALWDRIRIAAERDGYSSVAEAVRHSMREYAKNSEAHAARVAQEESK